MSDELQEALDWYDNNPNYTMRPSERVVVAAARNWQTYEKHGERVSLRLDEYDGGYGFLDDAGLTTMPDEGEYLLVPVDALTVTAEEDR